MFVQALLGWTAPTGGSGGGDKSRRRQRRQANPDQSAGDRRIKLLRPFPNNLWPPAYQCGARSR